MNSEIMSNPKFSEDSEQTKEPADTYSETAEILAPPAADEEDGSMTIIDQGSWDQYKVKNNYNPYGQGIIKYAERWASLMEEQINKGYDVASIADETSHEANTEEISRFMFSVAVNVLIDHWKYGEQLYEWYQSQYPS